MRLFRRLKIPTNTHPLVTQLFEKMNQEQIGLIEMAERSGINKNTISDWKHRCMPRLDNIDACYNVLGLKLEVRNDPRKA